jgi:SOS-response transcriptional repressor LexA
MLGLLTDRDEGWRYGDIVAAMIDDEATVKVYRTHGGRVELVPRNPRYR